MKSSLLLVAIAGAAVPAAAAPPPVAAAPPPPVAALLDQLAATRQLDEIALSPDGQRIAWVEHVADRSQPAGRWLVYAAPSDGRRPAVKIGEGRGIAWSHDGTRLAYIDKQLYVAAIGGPCASSPI